MKLNNRSLAIDVFRGLTVCFMIIVNTSGDGATTFAPLKHAAWDGFTPTDLVFPSFLFAVGSSMSFAMDKWRSMASSQVLYKIFKRTFIIFLLGYLMYWFPFFRVDSSFHIQSFPISETRIFGVLQRIALCYGIGALILYYLKPKWSVVISVLILLGYWAMYALYGNYDMLHNPVVDLDLHLFGASHLYHGEGAAFDPEGLLSTFPALVNVIAGFWAGDYIRRKGASYEALSKILLVGFIILSLGFMWNYGFAINKKLWTSSYVLLTVGLDCCLLAMIVYYTDLKQRRQGVYFFQVFGRNTLAIYLLSELLVILLYITPAGDTSLFRWIFVHVFKPFGGYPGAFLFAIAYMLVCWSVGYVLDKKKIYIKI